MHLWHAQQEKMKQLSAAITLKSRMAAFETIDATAITANAITRATELQTEAQTTTLQTNLRLANLEKTTRKQEQKVNEFSKLLRHNDKKQKHSNSNQNQGHENRNMVYLTTDDGDSPQPSSSSPTPFPKFQKNPKRKQNDLALSPSSTKRSNKSKKVHWNLSEQQLTNHVNTASTQPPNNTVAPPISFNYTILCACSSPCPSTSSFRQQPFHRTTNVSLYTSQRSSNKQQPFN
jgi:hypothetical protein